MLRYLIVSVLIFFSFILQSCALGNADFGGIVPSLMIILTSAYGFMRGERADLWVGFICGFLFDICFGTMLGFYALIYMYIGFVNGRFSRIFYPEDIKLPLSLISLSDLTYSVICYLLLFFVNGKFYFGWYFLHIILPELIYTILTTIFIYPFILFIDYLLRKRERKREQKFV